MTYSKLKDKYVIMICPFDPFKRGRHFYSFTSRCDQDHDLQLGDKSMTIILNADGTMDDVGSNLRAFLDYVAGKASEDAYVQKLEVAVKRAKANKEWRRDYMTARMRDLENQEIGERRGEQNTLVRSIANLMKNMQMTLEQAMDALSIPSDQRSMYAGMINKK